MRKHRLLMATAAAMFMSGSMMFSVGGALAQNNCPGVSGQQCDAFCGGAENVLTCTKTGPTPDCDCKPTTKDVNGNAFGTEETESVEGQGNIGNKPEEECVRHNGRPCK